jgi:hypothetical protein
MMVVALSYNACLLTYAAANHNCKGAGEESCWMVDKGGNFAAGAGLKSDQRLLAIA